MNGKEIPVSPSTSEAFERFWSSPDVKDTLEGYARVAVGASGGADSQALLFLMAAPGTQRPEWAPELVAFHIDHGLRDTAADRAVVEALCERLGLRLYVRRLSQKRLEKQRKATGSLEAALRSERYRAFASMARRSHCDMVVTAHHRDDVAETFMLRLLRGSGLNGLGGMECLTEIDGLLIGRPLLGWSREELRDLAKDAGLEWSEDPTNRDESPMRNRVRRKILPVIEQYTDHPPAARILARTARLLAREGRVLQAVARPLYEHHCLRISERQLGLDLRAFREEAPDEMLPYLLRLLWCELLDTAYPPSLEHLDALADFALSGRNGLHQSDMNVVAMLDRGGRLWCYRKPRRRMSRQEIVASMRCEQEKARE
ncbi:MAG: tRNA lysidine(34) synthetase TilS [Candidatus Sumerlaeota bacterium]